MPKNALFSLMLLLLLAACATKTPMSTPVVQNQESWDNRQATLSQLTQWQAQGALAIQTSKGTDSMQFDWQLHSQNNYSLRFIGPVGTGYGTLSTTPTQSIYLAPKGKTYTDRNAEALLNQVTGWQLPVNDLYYWARGLPAPTSNPTLRFDTNHSHLSGLEQDGFTLTFERYSGVGSVDLPTKLVIQNDAVKIKIVVTRWQLN